MLGDIMTTGGGNGGASSFATSSRQPYARWRYWGSFLQDDYRITPNFTLNVGLRYGIFGSFKTRQFNGR
jgi:outer membrane receptor protein involved in Fe transport